MAIDIAKLIAQHLGPRTEIGIGPATLTKVTAGTRTPGAASGGTNPTTADYACRGLVSDYDAAKIDGTLIERGDREVTLLGATIASAQVPTTQDRVTIADTPGGALVTYQIVRVGSDPVAATYTLQVRR